MGISLKIQLYLFLFWLVCVQSNADVDFLQIAELVATEFFEQGDKERRELNIEPIVRRQILTYWTLFCHIT